VFRAFFFFFGCALVVAHRIDWYGTGAKRWTCGLDTAIELVVSLLRGAINDRGCAIAASAGVDGGRDCAKSSVGDSGMPRHDAASTLPPNCAFAILLRPHLSCPLHLTP